MGTHFCRRISCLSGLTAFKLLGQDTPKLELPEPPKLRLSKTWIIPLWFVAFTSLHFKQCDHICSSTWEWIIAPTFRAMNFESIYIPKPFRLPDYLYKRFHVPWRLNKNRVLSPCFSYNRGRKHGTCRWIRRPNIAWHLFRDGCVGHGWVWDLHHMPFDWSLYQQQGEYKMGTELIVMNGVIVITIITVITPTNDRKKMGSLGVISPYL